MLAPHLQVTALVEIVISSLHVTLLRFLRTHWRGLCCGDLSHGCATNGRSSTASAHHLQHQQGTNEQHNKADKAQDDADNNAGCAEIH